MLDPLLVNTVVGFIGPEYLYDGKQIVRAGLEDHFCGKLLGLPMGVDVCYTNHAEADQDDMDTLLTLLGTAGASFVIAVPGADDVMLATRACPSTTCSTCARCRGCGPRRSSRRGSTGSACSATPAGSCPPTSTRSPLRELTAR